MSKPTNSALGEFLSIISEALETLPVEPPKKRPSPALKKGQIIRYTGTYAPGVRVWYGTGRVTAFRDYRRVVTVELLEDDGRGTGFYADWPTDEVERVTP